MTNIAMENPPIFNRYAIYKWAIYTMVMLNKERASRCWSIPRIRQALQQRLRDAHLVELANCQASAAFEATVAKATSTTRTTTSGVLEMRPNNGWFLPWKPMKNGGFSMNTWKIVFFYMKTYEQLWFYHEKNWFYNEKSWEIGSFRWF